MWPYESVTRQEFESIKDVVETYISPSQLFLRNAVNIGARIHTLFPSIPLDLNVKKIYSYLTSIRNVFGRPMKKQFKNSNGILTELRYLS